MRETASIQYARVVELADSLDSGSSVQYARAGSSPASRTKRSQARKGLGFFCFPENSVAQGKKPFAPPPSWFPIYYNIFRKNAIYFRKRKSDITWNLTRPWAVQPGADYKNIHRSRHPRRSALQLWCADIRFSSLLELTSLPDAGRTYPGC